MKSGFQETNLELDISGKNAVNNEFLTYYEGKNILITGGRGYIGTNITNALSEIYCQIIRLGRSGSPAQGNNRKAKVKDIICDISNQAAWDKLLYDLDIVFHLAAQTSVHTANDNPIEDFRSNVLPMLHLLEACRKDNLHPKIVFAGSVTEAGVPKTLPVDESCLDDPITVYDLHKLMAENYLKYYSNQGHIKGVSLRMANIYGPGPKSSSSDRGIINMMIQKALKGEDLTLYGGSENIRDYLYVDDAVRAFLIAGTKTEDLNGQHFVIGSGKGHSLKSMFDLIAEITKRTAGKDVNVINMIPPASQLPIDERNFVANSTAFSNKTNWTPAHSLEDGIDKTIHFFTNQGL